MKQLRRCLAVLPAVPLCALGVAIFVRANLGSDPLTMFEIALSNLLSISLGTTSFAFEGFIFILFFMINRKLINFGSFAFAFGIGPCIDLFTNLLNQLLPETNTLLLQTMYLIFGTLFICISLAYYIPMDFGYQTSDILALSVSEWFKLSYGISFSIVYAILFVSALLLGGPWGIGTVVATLVFGPIIDFLKERFAPYSLKIAGVVTE